MKVLVWCPKGSMRIGGELIAAAQADVLKEWFDVHLHVGWLQDLDLSQFDAAVVNGLTIPDGFPDRTFVYCWKQLDLGHGASVERWVRHMVRTWGGVKNWWKEKAVLCTDVGTHKFLNRIGIPAVHSQIGYNKTFEVGPGESFEHGIYFLGTTSGYRRRFVLRSCNAVCPRNCYGEQREKMMRSPGVHLNFSQRFRLRVFHYRVIVHLLSNRRAVVSAPTPHAPLVNNQHWFERSIDRMADTALSLVKDEEACRQIGECGYEHIKKNLNLRDTFGLVVHDALSG
jgi:hypothetical protein